MRALIAKEWRDHRTVAFGLTILGLLLSCGLLLVPAEPEDPNRAADLGGLALIVMSGLFAVVLAADLVAGETASGRIAFFAALPVRPAKLFLAKALFLLALGGAFLMFAAFAIALPMTIAGRAPPRLGEALGAASASAALLALTAGAMTLFYSTILPHAMAAALGGLVTLSAVLLAAHRMKDVLQGRVDYALALGLLLLAGHAVGAFVAFTRGRLHLRAPVRRALLGGGALLTVLAIGGTAAGLAVADEWDLDPSDEGLQVKFVASCGDRWAVFEVDRGTPAGPRALWALRLDADGFRDLTPFLLDPDGPHRIVLAGERSKVHVFEVVGREYPFAWWRTEVDLDDGAFTRSAVRPPEIQPPSKRKAPPLPAGWSRLHLAQWGSIAVEAGPLRRPAVVMADGRMIPTPPGTDWKVVRLPPLPTEPVVWRDPLGTQVLRTPLDGGPPEVRALPARPGGVVAFPGDVVLWWDHEGGALYAIPGAGPPRRLLPQED